MATIPESGVAPQVDTTLPVAHAGPPTADSAPLPGNSNTSVPESGVKASPVTTISSDDAASDLSDLNDTHAAALDNANTGDADETTATPPAGSITPQDASDLGITDLSGYTFDKGSGYYTPNPGTPVLDTASLSSAKSTLQNDEDTILKLYNSGMSSNDASTQQLVQSIKEQYQGAFDAQNELNNATNAKYSTYAIRSGTGAMATNGGVITAAANAGISKLSDLSAKMSAALSNASAASDKNAYSLYSKAMDDYTTAKDAYSKTLLSIQQEAVKANAAVAKNTTQASRDSAIDSEIANGVTDPSQMLADLNGQDNSSIGGSFTAKEISDTLKILAPDGTLQGLTGNVKNFFILKGTGQLPSSVSSLPPEQQLPAYLASLKTSSASGGTITTAIATKNGWPLSTVGMTQAEITQSLYNSKVPAWFTEKYQNENKESATPDALSSAWETYRQGIISSSGGDSASSTESVY